MTSREFCYWLQGFFELLPIGEDRPAPVSLSADQVERIRRHLALVFVHDIDPSQGDAKQQALLNAIHGPGPTTASQPMGQAPAWMRPQAEDDGKPRPRC